jgi:peptidoglycan/LPS O-acetylase OafA/YrhL
VRAGGTFWDTLCVGAAESSIEAEVRRLGPVPALDGLRGVAVLLVMASHVRYAVPETFAGFNFNEKVQGGFLGVDLFFVLSGFLITALLLREQGDRGAVRFGSFYGRRALRLLPALYVLLAAHALYAWVAGLSWENEVMTTKWALVYATNWQAAWHLFTVSPGLGHLWSLAIEEQFYLVWPAILIAFLGLKRNANVAIAAIVVAIVAVVVHRFVLYDDGVFVLSLFVRTDTRADSLLVGALLASLWVRRKTPTRGLAPAAWVATVVIVAFVVASEPSSAFLYKGGFTIFAIAAAVLVLATIDSDWIGNRLLSWSPLRLAGRVSYGLYLWHLAVFVAVYNEGASWSPWTRAVVSLGLTILFTAVSWKLVESPALRLKARLGRTSSGSTLEGDGFGFDRR